MRPVALRARGMPKPQIPTARTVQPAGSLPLLDHKAPEVGDVGALRLRSKRGLERR
jgi:hypothetical protein